MAFHPLPQVIPHVFNHGGFGPPRGLTPASACPWIDHSASGLQHATERPVQTRFRSGSPSRVNLATHRNSLAHSSKGTPSRRQAETCRDALTDCEPTVSGTISLPSRGAFHLSLTVLVRYRSPDLYLALRSGLRRFVPAFTVPALLGNTELSLISFAYGAITLYGATFQNASARYEIGNSVRDLVLSLSGPTTPDWQRHQALPPVSVWAIPVSLAATQGVAVAFLSSRY